MGEEDARDLLHRLEEAISKIERDARRDFAELLKEALRRIPYQTYPKGKIWDTVFETIDNLLNECEED